MTVVEAVPFNQKIRIHALRISFLLALPAILFGRSVWMHPAWLFEILEMLGLTLIFAGVLGRFWSILYIGGRKNETVLQDGPYSTCRHPLYFFSALAVIGFGLMLGSLVLTAILGGITIAILTATAAREEIFLRAEFGAAYEDYAARVPRFWPRLSLYESPPEVTFNVETLRRNLMDALVFLTFIPLAEFMEFVHDSIQLPYFNLW